MRMLVNGVEASQMSAMDRGLAYGDGVFETLLVADGQPVWWDAHLARLQRGCAVLGIEAPAPRLLREEAASLATGAARAVLKVIVTRGAGGRGYAPPLSVAPTRLLSLHPAALPLRREYSEGVALRWCETTLAIQPALAGIKHLNRLEQVLARKEWHDDVIVEGLMCDADGRVVCATAANLFVVREGRLLTPRVDRCGIAGIAREWVLARRQVEIVDLAPSEVESADELFLGSSLRGILPVSRLGGREWNVGPMTRALQQLLWDEVPALRPIAEAEG